MQFVPYICHLIASRRSAFLIGTAEYFPSRRRNITFASSHAQRKGEMHSLKIIDRLLHTSLSSDLQQVKQERGSVITSEQTIIKQLCFMTSHMSCFLLQVIMVSLIKAVKSRQENCILNISSTANLLMGR